uniref:Uncharacterized protein LOC104229334 isoform X3 n=1 Tax=Nicotiana sylvestris TaxID=4096 RepID=A0A1U7X1A7_NICSY|nr:PREDICTED: uncharacterized protein LOC104229334 isoform X3 [Nicotiana sylvestris]
MKLSSLAAYFRFEEQPHRSLPDVRMNLEVLKHCGTVLFLFWMSVIFLLSRGTRIAVVTQNGCLWLTENIRAFDCA